MRMLGLNNALNIIWLYISSFEIIWVKKAAIENAKALTNDMKIKCMK